MGRPPKPTTSLRLAGTYRPDRHGADAEPTSDPAKCPPWLTQAARDRWPEVYQIVKSMGLSSRDYTIGLSLLCDALAAWIAACTEADGLPYAIENDRGVRVSEPVHRAKRQAWDAVMKACREFGMTPVAMRGVLKQGDDAAKDDMDKRMFGG